MFWSRSCGCSDSISGCCCNGNSRSSRVEMPVWKLR
nr:MAG TPA: hypothetical protein [Caudoviricetes sp.]